MESTLGDEGAVSLLEEIVHLLQVGNASADFGCLRDDETYCHGQHVFDESTEVRLSTYRRLEQVPSGACCEHLEELKV